ncbi:MAG TPA: AI-2E family transporter [Paludibacter sp.]|nr:AI-2E family transporter [Paludibacter sp.]
MKTRPYTFDRVVRILIGLTVLFLLFLLVKKLSGVLLPFVIAWLLAYLLNPIVGFFQFRLRLKNRVLSVISTLVLFIALLFGVISFLTPIIGAEVRRLSDLIVRYSQGLTLNKLIPPSVQNDIQRYLTQLDVQTIFQNEHMIAEIKRLAPQIWNLVYGSLNFLFGLTVVAIVFLYLIFILIDYEKMSQRWPELIPPKYRGLVSGVVYDLKVAMNRYFRGQALIAFSVGILLSVGFSIIGLPLAILLGLFVGMLDMVPYLKIVGLVPALLLAFLKSAETGQSFIGLVVALAIVFVVVQIIQDLLLTPRIMGKVTGMNPAIILLSLSVWGSLMGVFGMIIALPMTTLISSYYNRFVLHEPDTKNEDPRSVVGKIRKETEDIDPA